MLSTGGDDDCLCVHRIKLSEAEPVILTTTCNKTAHSTQITGIRFLFKISKIGLYREVLIFVKNEV